jgi:hypothetical protein
MIAPLRKRTIRLRSGASDLLDLSPELPILSPHEFLTSLDD